MKIFLAGPIDYWWNENWNSPEHVSYKAWREEVNRLFVEAGHLVYRPHEAIKGAWDESMQQVNDLAIKLCDVFVYLTPADVPAYGTAAERDFAEIIGKQIRWAPPWDESNIADLIVPLADPYGAVNRKSYTKISHNGSDCEIYVRPDTGQKSCEFHCKWVDEDNNEY